MPIRGLYCANYRVAVGHLGTNAIQLLNLNTPISGPYCINYRVVVSHLGDERHPTTLFKHAY